MSRGKINILFFFQEKITLRRRKRLKAFLSNVLEKKAGKVSGEVRIIFCSDEELLQINRDFLAHDYYTDIITFPFTKPSEKNIEAELYISVDRVRENAKVLEASLERGLHRVVFHGVLHLCGLDDKSGAQASAMRRAEDLLLMEYFNVPHKTVSS